MALFKNAQAEVEFTVEKDNDNSCGCQVLNGKRIFSISLHLETQYLTSGIVEQFTRVYVAYG